MRSKNSTTNFSSQNETIRQYLTKELLDKLEFIAFVSCLWGILLESLLIMAIANYIKLNQKEIQIPLNKNEITDNKKALYTSFISENDNLKNEKMLFINRNGFKKHSVKIKKLKYLELILYLLLQNFLLLVFHL